VNFLDIILHCFNIVFLVHLASHPGNTGRMTAKPASVAIMSLDVHERATVHKCSFEPTKPAGSNEFVQFMKCNVLDTITRFHGKKWLWLHTPVIVLAYPRQCYHAKQQLIDRIDSLE
jgi:hypothetical protein